MAFRMWSIYDRLQAHFQNNNLRIQFCFTCYLFSLNIVRNRLSKKKKKNTVFDMFLYEDIRDIWTYWAARINYINHCYFDKRKISFTIVRMNSDIVYSTSFYFFYFSLSLISSFLLFERVRSTIYFLTKILDFIFHRK